MSLVLGQDVRRRSHRLLHLTHIRVAHQKVIICDQGTGVGGIQLGLEPVKIEQQLPQVLGLFSRSQMNGQVMQTVPVAVGPAAAVVLQVVIDSG